MNIDKLKEHGITAIVNLAHGTRVGYYDNESNLKEVGIQYFGYSLTDSKRGSIDLQSEQTFVETIEKVDELMKTGENQVMITCLMGMSRSATACILYLMLKQNMTPYQAVKQLREVRDVFPNKHNLSYVVRLWNKRIPATIKILQTHLISIEPPERLIEYDTQLPFNPELKKKALEVYKTKDMTKIAKFCEDGLSDDCFVQVYPKVWIGNRKSVDNIEGLKANSITAIVNVAHGTKFAQYLGNADKLQENGIEYYGVQVSDFIKSEFNLEHEKALLEAPEIIAKLVENDKEVLITCFAGMSRSATAIIMFLMLHENMTAFDALAEVRNARDVFPSKDQLLYVARLHNKLFGFENQDVIDVDLKDDPLRSIVKNSSVEA